jgi:hypothetical protein
VRVSLPHKVAIWVVLFILGVVVGSLLPVRSVLAQESREESGNWIIQPMDKPGLYAYLLNTHRRSVHTRRYG